MLRVNRNLSQMLLIDINMVQLLKWQIKCEIWNWQPYVRTSAQDIGCILWNQGRYPPKLPISGPVMIKGDLMEFNLHVPVKESSPTSNKFVYTTTSNMSIILCNLLMPPVRTLNCSFVLASWPVAGIKVWLNYNEQKQFKHWSLAFNAFMIRLREIIW